MVVVADASVAIRGDLSGFHQDLNRAKADTGTLGDKLKNALSPRNIIAGAGLLGIGLGLRNLIGWAGDAAGAFQELQQTTETVDSVFGKSADKIEDWGERAAGAAGLSKREVSESAATMGLMLTNMGFDADAAADMVVKAQQRASDLAISLGKDTGQAILGISALLRGEFDTIEKLGVRIKQSDVNAREIALGLDTSTASAKKYADAVAALDLFFEQTEGSSGRFADSQDKVSVKMAQAAANADNLELQFGQMVTEIENGAFIVGDAIGDAVGAVGNFFDEAQDPRLFQLAEILEMSVGDAHHMVRQAQNETGQNWDTVVDGMLMSAYELGEGGAESFDHFTAAFTQMGQNVQATASGVGDVVAFAIPAAVLAHWDSIKQAGMDTMTAYNEGIFESQSSFASEIDALLTALDEHLAPGEEIAELRGQKVALLYARGVHANEPDAVAAIDAMIDRINLRLNTLSGYIYGKNLMTTLASGIYDYATRPGEAAGYAAAKIRGQLQIRSEPPDPSSPLRGITTWGGNIVKTIAEGITGELGTGAAAAQALAGALVPSFGGAAMGAPAGMAGGNTVQDILQVQGDAKVVGSRDDVIDAWLQMSTAGEGRS